MSCRRTSSMSLLVAVLLIMDSLLSLHAPVAYARHVVVLNPNDGLNDRGDSKNLSEVLASASTDDSAANKGLLFSGRKLGAANKEERTKATTGASMATTASSAGSRPRTVKMRVAVKHVHGDAAAEMYDMLRRDYASRASRRRPINNGATRFQVKQP